MSDEFVVRKGAAVPAATHPGDAARFHARRTIVLPAINLHASTQTEYSNARGRYQPPRTARLTGPASAEKRRFTFRIDPARHAAFCRAAESQNVSRQRLLSDALDALLVRLGHAPDMAAPPPYATANAITSVDGGALLLPDRTAALHPAL
jgi:hypothetical protein